MRRFLISLLCVLAAPSLALAQQRAPGPFQLGMTVAEAQATFPGATWREMSGEDGDELGMMSNLPVYLANAPYMPGLFFVDGVLSTRGLRTPVRGCRCGDVHGGSGASRDEL